MRVTLCLGAGVLLTATVLAAQPLENPRPSPPQTTPQTVQPPRVYRTTGSRIAIGRSIRVERDEEVNDAVVVVGGSLRVEGRVRDGLVVVGGDIELGPEAEVSGDVIVVGGQVRREAGAQLQGSVSDVTIGDWRPWTIGGWGIPVIGVDMGDFGRWLTLFGAIFRVSLLIVLMALILIVARGPVARIGRAAAAEPGRAMVIGLAAEVLFIPALIIASIALVVTIIGIPLVIVLVPMALLTAFFAMMLGFTALACRVGEWLEDRVGWRGHSAFLACMLGLLVILGPTMISRLIGVAPLPLRVAAFGLLVTGVLIEFIVWTIGLGATLMTGFGRWSTAPPPVPTPAMPVVQSA
jgi:hypothetical protein